VGQRILISYAFRDARLHFWPAPGYIHTSNMHVFYVRAINTTPRGPTSNRPAVILLGCFSGRRAVSHSHSRYISFLSLSPLQERGEGVLV
jgi:hypothetical protein